MRYDSSISCDHLLVCDRVVFFDFAPYKFEKTSSFRRLFDKKTPYDHRTAFFFAYSSLLPEFPRKIPKKSLPVLREVPPPLPLEGLLLRFMFFLS